MGVAFGASAPVLFSAIGAGTEGKRASLVYPLATGFGVLICACLFYIIGSVVRYPFLADRMNPFSIAAVNTVLRFLMVLFLLPFTDVIEAAVTALVPEQNASDRTPEIRLEERFIAYPALAIEQSRLTIHEMSKIAERSIRSAIALFSGFTDQGFSSVKTLENDADRYEDSLGTYLIKITAQEMTKTQNEKSVNTCTPSRTLNGFRTTR